MKCLIYKKRCIALCTEALFQMKWPFLIFLESNLKRQLSEWDEKWNIWALASLFPSSHQFRDPCVCVCVWVCLIIMFNTTTMGILGSFLFHFSQPFPTQIAYVRNLVIMARLRFFYKFSQYWKAFYYCYILIFIIIIIIVIRVEERKRKLFLFVKCATFP